MKPLNLDNKPCSPISSNCVVWQGPDIPCIELCTGDTVSDVVSAMATELCTVLDTLKVSNYDLTCFNLQACGPTDFQALIQFLITKICENEGLTSPTKDLPTCPDCVVSVAECFVTGTQTTMQLVDYVQLIGQRLCSIITEISLLNTQITDILIRVTTLENAPVPTFTVPQFTITCASFPLSGTQPIDVILEEFINSVWCGFYAVTGSTTDLTNAIGTQEPCITETSETITKPGTTYPSEYPAWVAEPSTIADSITNIWLVLCDLHTALLTPTAITVADEGITLTSTLSSMDFTGAGVTATAIGNAVTVNVPAAVITNDTFFCQVSISNAFNPIILTTPGTASNIPTLAAAPVRYTDAPKMTLPNRVGYNNSLLSSSGGGSFVSQVDVDSLLTGANAFGSFLVQNGANGATFTFSENGVYLVTAFAYLKPDDGGSGGGASIPWQLGVNTVVDTVDFAGTSVTTVDLPTVGSFGIALIASGINIYGGNSVPTIAGLNQDITLDYSRVVYGTVGAIVRLAVLNLSDRNYNGISYNGADNLGFSITKLGEYTP